MKDLQNKALQNIISSIIEDLEDCSRDIFEITDFINSNSRIMESEGDVGSVFMRLGRLHFKLDLPMKTLNNLRNEIGHHNET